MALRGEVSSACMHGTEGAMRADAGRIMVLRTGEGVATDEETWLWVPEKTLTGDEDLVDDFSGDTLDCHDPEKDCTGR